MPCCLGSDPQAAGAEFPGPLRSNTQKEKRKAPTDQPSSSGQESHSSARAAIAGVFPRKKSPRVQQKFPRQRNRHAEQQMHWQPCYGPTFLANTRWLSGSDELVTPIRPGESRFDIRNRVETFRAAENDWPAPP